jgi:hypothetical protein
MRWWRTRGALCRRLPRIFTPFHKAFRDGDTFHLTHRALRYISGNITRGRHGRPAGLTEQVVFPRHRVGRNVRT